MKNLTAKNAKGAKRRLRLVEADERPFLAIMRAETPLEATRRFLDQVQKLDDNGKRRVLGLASDLRAEITQRLVSAKDFEAYRLPQLRTDLERTMDDWRQKYNLAQSEIFRDYASLGQAQIEGVARAAGVNIQMPAMSVKLLDVAQRFSADLVRRVTRDTIQDINREVILAAQGVQSPFEAIKNVEKTLDDPLTFSSLFNRAETILRTEGGRIQSIAAQGRMEDAAEVVPGLKKQWWASFVGRQNHAAIHKQIKNVDESFEVPAGRRCAADELMFPRDPSGSACQTINCGCQSIPYKVEWDLDKLAA